MIINTRTTEKREVRDRKKERERERERERGFRDIIHEVHFNL